MLKIKHFLMALTFIPLSLTAFHLPTNAQSKGIAGFQSGNATGGNITFSTSTGGITTLVFVITQAQLETLQNVTPEAGGVIELLKSPVVGTATVITQPSSTTEGQVSYTEAGKQPKVLPYPFATGTLSQADVLAIVTLGGKIGASDAQIRTAVAIASTGASPEKTFEMLINASALFASAKAKSSEKDFILAQASGTVTVDAAALAAAIDSYNDLLNASQPATVAKLSENQPFMRFGGALRSLRSAYN